MPTETARSERLATAPPVAQVAQVDDLTDRELCDLVGIGSACAIETLFRRHYSFCVGYARSLGADQHLAEDLGSEVFTNTWLQLERRSAVRSLRPYLATAIRRLYLRQASRSQPTPIGEVWDHVSTWSTPTGDLAETLVTIDEIQGLFGRLPDRQRAVLYLTAVCGLDLEEVSARLGLPSRGAAAVLAYRARLAARNLFMTTRSESSFPGPSPP